jgi:1-acyl-sn-glycerol-3-phosphate acyltransferase
MIAWLIVALTKIVLGPSVTHRAPLDEMRPRVFFANHSSHLDFLVLWASLPAEQRRVTRPVAARDYWSQGRLRRWLVGRLFGGLMIARSSTTAGKDAAPDDNPVAQMLDVLAGGDSLILFPEGTRGAGDVVAQFRSGLFQIAQARPDVDLVPVHLENFNRILPKGEFVPVPMLSRVTFGAPLERVDAEDRAAFLERARAAVVALEEDDLTPGPFPEGKGSVH